jgi:cytidylate kinase
VAIITISRGAKSGGAELAQRLSERLGYSCKSREVVLEGAKKYNIMAEELYRRLDESPGLWNKLTRDHERYLIYVQCAVIDAVREDNVIYHGSAGQLFLRGIQHVLRVLLEAPIEERVKTVMQESGKDDSEAADYIAKIDTQKIRWFKLIFGEQWRDPSLYDMSFSTRKLTIDSICDIVALAVRQKEFRTTEQSVRLLNNLSLECEVKAAFAADDKIWNLPIEISANNGVVELRGIVKDAKLRDVVAEVAGQVKGVKECRCQINLSTDPLSRGIYGHD